MVLVRKWQFFQLFLLGNIDKENRFYDILEKKKRLSNIKKNKKLKKSKNGDFSKRDNPKP